MMEAIGGGRIKMTIKNTIITGLVALALATGCKDEKLKECMAKVEPLEEEFEDLCDGDYASALESGDDLYHLVKKRDEVWKRLLERLLPFLLRVKSRSAATLAFFQNIEGFEKPIFDCGLLIAKCVCYIQNPLRGLLISSSCAIQGGYSKSTIYGNSIFDAPAGIGAFQFSINILYFDKRSVAYSYTRSIKFSNI